MSVLLDLLRGNGNGSNGATSQGTQTRYALAYLRVSTEDQNEEVQRADIERYAAHESITVLEWFKDHAKSASGDHENRREFWRMVETAKADKRVSFILIWDESRFMRDDVQATIVKADLRAHGVRVIPVKHPYNADTIDGVLLEKIHQALAQIEAMKIAERTIAGLSYNCQQRDPETGWCYKNGGRAPYGYRVERVQRGADRPGQSKFKELWVKDDALDAGRPRWEWVRLILLDWYVGERLSYKRIIHRLNKLGVMPYETAHNMESRRTNSWTLGTLHLFFRPEKLLTYAGYYFWNKYRRRNKAGKRRGKKRKPVEEWVKVENAHEAILSAAEVETILAEMQRRQRRKPYSRQGRQDTTGSPYLLSGGLATCGRCDSRLTSHVGSVRGKQFRHYACSLSVASSRTECGKTYLLPVHLIHNTIWRLITAHLPTSDTAIRTLTRQVNDELLKERKRPEAKREELEKKLRDLERDRQRLSEAFRKGADPQWVADESKRLRTEEEGTRRKLAAVESRSKSDPPRRVSETDIRQWIEGVKDAMQGDDNEAKRRVFRAFIKTVTLYPDAEQVEVRFNQREDVCPSEVAELADAADSKSVGAYPPCGFDSLPRHQVQTATFPFPHSSLQADESTCRA